MMHQSRSSFFMADIDANISLYDGCRYPFKQTEYGTWISFSDVLSDLQQQQQPGDDYAVDSDICLSYIFCRLLARRYFGFPCAEDGNTQVRELVLTELLVEDYNRAFRLVEVQLALLHDYFFTNYHSKITDGFVSAKKGVFDFLTLSASTLTGMAITFLITGEYKKGRSCVVSLISAAIPSLLMVILFKLQLTPFLPRHWHPIQNAFLYYDETAIDQSAGPRTSRPYEYWRDKLSKYSVIEDYDHHSSMNKIIAWCKIHILSQVSYSFIKHHPAQGEEVPVPDSIRRFLAHTLMDLDGPPTIGTRSPDDLSWTYRQDLLTHTVLIWHIATNYCEMMSPCQPPAADEANAADHEAATILSSYCAYLVAFVPELLLEHSLTAKVVLQHVLQEPRDVLGRTRMSMEEKGRRIRELELPEDESNLMTFQKGVRLGRQLQQQPDISLRWKVMADFWAEMILYLASSDNTSAAHVEQLAQGGEFITHLWALLCNAGIPKQKQTR